VYIAEILFRLAVHLGLDLATFLAELENPKKLQLLGNRLTDLDRKVRKTGAFNRSATLRREKLRNYGTFSESSPLAHHASCSASVVVAPLMRRRPEHRPPDVCN
jgi:hypothetical protein